LVLRCQFAALVILSAVGCNSIWNGWLDPSQVGRFRGPAQTMELRRSISVADEPEMDIHGVDPTPEDLQAPKHDYVLHPGDVIDVSIFELMFPGEPWIQVRRVSHEGQIRLPQVTQDIVAAGKTTRELEKHIEEVLKAEQIQMDPTDVTVLLRDPRGMAYNILGYVGAPGNKRIPRPNFRLLDALGVAGGMTPVGGPRQPTVRTMYVFRAQPYQPPAGQGDIAAQSQAGSPLNLTSLGTRGAGDVKAGHWIYVNGEWKFVERPRPTTAPAASAPAKREPVTQPAVEKVETWEELAAEIPQQRILAIPVDKLLQGEPRYNVVIRAGDTIFVPGPAQGEFYMMGNVRVPGVYMLTGREITLRQAISAAGGLHPLADPTRCELVRRIGGNQEQSIQVNLDRIFAGKEPDIILKRDDIINVGTNPVMPFLAVLRNAFRATYGFGFLYDRNFADIDSFEPQSNPTDRRRSERAQRFGF